ncbi:MAG: class I SAM-dependent methyltransferase [Spirochaetales bacterium]|nr:class I SAM-dependent methyltransferase [Spirochaetales bacterium]
MLTTLKLKLLNAAASTTLNTVMDLLPFKEGDTVADIGSGGGCYTLAFARRTGNNGEVYAVDPDTRNLKFISARAAEAGLSQRIILVAAEPDDCLLAPESIDLAFSRNSFHHIKDPLMYFAVVHRCLKPHGHLAVIDHGKSGKPGVPQGHWTEPLRIREVLTAVGFEESARYTHLPGQSFHIFKKN